MEEWLWYLAWLGVASVLFLGAELRRWREAQRTIDRSASIATPPFNGPRADA